MKSLRLIGLCLALCALCAAQNQGPAQTGKTASAAASPAFQGSNGFVAQGNNQFNASGGNGIVAQ